MKTSEISLTPSNETQSEYLSLSLGTKGFHQDKKIKPASSTRWSSLLDNDKALTQACL